jgi:hypothetical protein
MQRLDVKFTLVSEGQSEEPLVSHLRQLCVKAGADEATGSWFDFRRLRSPPGKNLGDQLDCVLSLMHGLDIVFIHRDADDREDATARGVVDRDVARLTQAGIDHVAVIPIQALEAWLLVDHRAIRRVVGNLNGRVELGLPPLGGIERLANPKAALRDAIERAAEATGRRRRDLLERFGHLRRTLLERLDIDGPVQQLSSWTALVVDIERCISRLHERRRDL